MSKNLDHLWDRFWEHQDEASRDQLIEGHMGLVYQVARKMVRSLSGQVDLSELVSSGTVGLIQAVDNFDGERGLAFSTYAVTRIRGAIIDDLRSRDNASRSLRKREREVERVRTDLEQRLGRNPSDSEMADALGVEVQTFWEWQGDIAALAQVPLAGSSTPMENREAGSLQDVLADPNAEDPQERLEQDALRERLKSAVEQLGERERLVLALYYYEELKLHQIAQVLNVTESRVSQIRSKAIRDLRALMAERD